MTEALVWALRNWKAMVFIAVVSFCVIQTERLRSCQSHLEANKQQVATAILENALRGAESGSEATQGLLEDEERDREAVGRVVDSIDSIGVCNNSVQVPASAELDAGRDTTSEDRIERALSRARESEQRERLQRELKENLKHDIAMCNRELNKKRRIVEWMIENGAADRK